MKYKLVDGRKVNIPVSDWMLFTFIIDPMCSIGWWLIGTKNRITFWHMRHIDGKKNTSG